MSENGYVSLIVEIYRLMEIKKTIVVFTITTLLVMAWSIHADAGLFSGQVERREQKKKIHSLIEICDCVGTDQSIDVQVESNRGPTKTITLKTDAEKWAQYVNSMRSFKQNFRFMKVFNKIKDKKYKKTNETYSQIFSRCDSARRQFVKAINDKKERAKKAKEKKKMIAWNAVQKKAKKLGYKGVKQFYTFADFIYAIQRGEVPSLNGYVNYIFNFIDGNMMLKVFQVTDKYVFYKYDYRYEANSIIAIPKVKGHIYGTEQPIAPNKYYVFNGILPYKTILGVDKQALLFAPINLN